MAVRDLQRGVSQGPSGVGKEKFLLLLPDQSEEQPRLRVIVLVVIPEVPVVCGSPQRERGLGEVGLLLPLVVALGLVAKRGAVVPVDVHGAVSVVAMHRAAG